MTLHTEPPRQLQRVPYPVETMSYPGDDEGPAWTNAINQLNIVGGDEDLEEDDGF